MELSKLGWTSNREKEFEYFKKHGLKQGRVVKKTRHLYQVYCELGLLQAEVSGHFLYTAIYKSDYPAIGDWVVLRADEDTAIIEKVLSRETTFSRKAAGESCEEQIIASNLDYLCIVCGLDGGRNFNLRAIERYVTMAREGGIQPVVVLNKADLSDQQEDAVSQVASLGGHLPVYLVSALTGEGLQEFTLQFSANSTLAFTGPSGVGKSSLINALLKDNILTTGRLRESDRRGRHTTTHSELFFLAGGAMVIDTPGLRELQLWGSQKGLEETFCEISEIAQNCRFRDCTHQGEPGCAVQQYLAEGGLDFNSYQNYLDMQTELKYVQSRVSGKGRLERKKQQKKLSRLIKQSTKKFSF